MEQIPDLDSERSIRHETAMLWLTNLQQKMQSLPQFATPLKTVEEASGKRLNAYLRPRNNLERVRFYRYDDAIAVLYSTDEWLEWREHQFTIPFIGEGVKYHRFAHNVDIQKVKSPTVQCNNFGELCDHDEGQGFFEFMSIIADIQQANVFENWDEFPHTDVVVPAWVLRRLEEQQRAAEVLAKYTVAASSEPTASSDL